MGNKSSIFIIFLLISIFVFPISCQKQKKDWHSTIGEVSGVIVEKNPKEPMYGESVLPLQAKAPRFALSLCGAGACEIPAHSHGP